MLVCTIGNFASTFFAGFGLGTAVGAGVVMYLVRRQDRKVKP